MKEMSWRIMSFLTRWLWRGVVLVILSAAVVVTTGREMAPLLSRYKGWLEDNLSVMVGEPVSVQGVSAYWKGLVPELAVQQLAIGDVVHVDKLLLRMDLLASARARALVFDTLELQHAVVKVPVGARTTDQTPDVRAYLEFLFSSADINIQNLEVNLVPEKQRPLVLHVNEVTIQNRDRQHQMKAVISVGQDVLPGNPVLDGEAPLQLAMEFHGEANDIFSGEGSAHLAFGDKRNLPELGQFLTGLYRSGASLLVTPQSDANGELWATWKRQRIDWVAETSFRDVTLSYTSEGDATSPAMQHDYHVDYSGKLSGSVLTEAMRGIHYSLQFPAGQEMTINGKSYALPALSWQYDKEDPASSPPTKAKVTGGMSVYIPALKLADIAQYLDLLPSETLRNAMDKLKPEGELTHIHVTLPRTAGAQDVKNPADDRLHIRANLEQVSVGAWKGAPALEHLDGYVDATPENGIVEFNSRQGFSMHYPEIYRVPLRYERASGRVYWDIDRDDQHVYVGGRQLELHGEEGELHGEFWLDLPPHDAVEAPGLYLSVGLVRADAKFRNKYLPETLDASLRQWLDKSIEKGTLSQSGFIYRGSLHDDVALDRSLAFFGNVQDARLKFDPAWPQLDKLDGSVLVDNTAVCASIATAHFLGFGLNHGSIGVSPSHFLTIDGDVSGSASALDIVYSTPLQKELGSVFDGWQLNGNTRGHLQLGINIGESTQKDFQEIDLHFADNNLLVGGVNLPLQQVNGDVHYSSTKGLSSSPLAARLWGNEQSITLAPEAGSHALPDVAVSISGSMDPPSLARWAHLPLLHFLSGSIPYQGKLLLPLEGSNDATEPLARLTVHSDLQGVAMDLPLPLTKAAEEKHSLDLHANLWKDKQQYQGNYGKEGAENLLSVAIEQNAQGALRGNITVNKASDPAAALPDGLHVRAILDEAALPDWVSAIGRYAAFAKADRELSQTAPSTSPAQAVSSLDAIAPSFDVQVHRLSIGALKMGETKLSAIYHEDKTRGNYWEANFQSAMMGGHYRYFDDTQHVPELELETILIGDADKKETSGTQAAAPENDDARMDPLAEVIPQDLPALRVHAKKVILKGDDVGDWRFGLQPDPQGVTVNDLVITMPGMAINGIGKNQGATLRWTRQGDAMHTEVTTHMSLNTQDGAKNLFNMERIVEADETDIEGTVGWQGSPAMISFRRLQGELSISSEKGRFLNSTTSTDLMRVINVFNFSTWARRLKLDFTDLYKKGVSYDEVKGQIHVDRGKVVFDQPLQLKGPSGRFELGGSLDSVQNTIDGSLIVTIPVNQNMAWVAAIAVSLPVAASVWAVSKIFGNEIDKLSSLQYSVTGSLDQPVVKFERLLPQLSSKEQEKATQEKNKKQEDTQKSDNASKDATSGVGD